MDEDEVDRTRTRTPRGAESRSGETATSRRRILVSSLFIPDSGSRAIVAEARRLIGEPSQVNCWHIPTAVFGEGASARQAEGRGRDLKQLLGFAQLKSIDIANVTGDQLR